MSARLRLVYFLYYAAAGANLPYFAPYLRGLGFSGEEIGNALVPAAALGPLAGLAWALAADRLRSPTRTLALCALGSACSAAFLLGARTALAVAAVMLAQALFERAVVPLTDALTLEHACTQPGVSYARIRLFGSMGFLVAAQGMGLFLSWRGDRPGDAAVPVVIVACVAAYALSAQRLPPLASATVRPRLADAGALARDPRLALLLAACALHWGACAPFHLLFGVYVRDLGQPATLTGAGMAAGVLAEVAVLLVYPRIERAVPLRARFGLAFGGSAVRWLLLSRATSAGALVGLQLLHGLTFGLFWAATTSALALLVPATLRVTGQALYAAVVFGLGNLAGYQLAGAGYDRFGSVAPLYLRAGLLEAGLCAVVLGLPWLRRVASR